MKPAPATSVRATSGFGGSAATIAWASSRGLRRGGFREPQRDVAGEVAMLRIACALDDDRGTLRRARKRSIAHAGQSAEQKLLELLLHGEKVRR